VPFSLQALAETPRLHPALFAQLLPQDIRKQLLQLVDFLVTAGVSYAPRLEDLGVSGEGQLKVFIPPAAIQQPMPTAHLQRAVAALGEWWEWIQGLYGAHRATTPQTKATPVLQPPKLSDNGDLELDDPTLQESTL
jgi:hypothetical protein